MKKIKEKSIPEWFDINNYSQAEFLTLRELFENLSERKNILKYYTSKNSRNLNEDPNFNYLLDCTLVSIIDCPVDSALDSTAGCPSGCISNRILERESKSNEFYKNSFNKIMKNPIIKGSVTTSHTLIYNRGRKIEYSESRPVRLLSFRELVRRYNSIKKKVEENKGVDWDPYQYIISNICENDDFLFERTALGTEMGVFLSEPCQDEISGYAYLSVNLKAPDEYILSNFKKWLAEIRTKTKDETAKADFYKKNYTQFKDPSILAYLDLQIWEQYSNCEFTNAAIGKAIVTKDGIDDAEYIRKTLRSKVDFIMKDSALDALDLQAIKEESE